MKPLRHHSGGNCHLIALDDFGSAYSALGSLRVLPINAVKMDRGLMAHLSTAEGDVAIVSAVIGVSRSLGLRVGADGVETREQFDFLKSHGCDEAQGSYFSPAVDPESFAAYALHPAALGAAKK